MVSKVTLADTPARFVIWLFILVRVGDSSGRGWVCEATVRAGDSKVWIGEGRAILSGVGLARVLDCYLSSELQIG